MSFWRKGYTVYEEEIRDYIGARLNHEGHKGHEGKEKSLGFFL
jgi:hypothetical protein